MMKQFECDKLLATLEFALSSSKLKNTNLTFGQIMKSNDECAIIEVLVEKTNDWEKHFEDLQTLTLVLKQFFKKVILTKFDLFTFGDFFEVGFGVKLYD